MLKWLKHSNQIAEIVSLDRKEGGLNYVVSKRNTLYLDRLKTKGWAKTCHVNNKQKKDGVVTLILIPKWTLEKGVLSGI